MNSMGLPPGARAHPDARTRTVRKNDLTRLEGYRSGLYMGERVLISMVDPERQRTGPMAPRGATGTWLNRATHIGGRCARDALRSERRVLPC